MHELTQAQFASIPFDGSDHDICGRLIRLSVDAKVDKFPMAWSQTTLARPVINIRNKENGVIVGGILAFYYDDWFVSIDYIREHQVNRHKYKLNSGDGLLRIDMISFGSSPKPHMNSEVTNTHSRDVRWRGFMADWRAVSAIINNSN